MGEVIVRKLREEDLTAAVSIWNRVVRDGMAFPQTEPLTLHEAEHFFSQQTYTGAAVLDGEVVGIYILHPNNVGRCGHIANASFAVALNQRGMHIGEALVQDCLAEAHRKGFRLLQFNAVVASNTTAQHLYERLGFVKIGTVPGGFRNIRDEYEDIILYYHKV